RGYISPSAFRDGLEDIARGREPRLDPDKARMNAARHNAANSWNKLSLVGHGHDARGGADDIHCVALTDIRSDRVPVRIECANGNWNSSTQTQRLRPLWRKLSGQVIARQVLPAKFRAHPCKQRVNCH